MLTQNNLEPETKLNLSAKLQDPSFMLVCIVYITSPVFDTIQIKSSSLSFKIIY